VVTLRASISQYLHPSSVFVVSCTVSVGEIQPSHVGCQVFVGCSKVLMWAHTYNVVVVADNIQKEYH